MSTGDGQDRYPPSRAFGAPAALAPWNAAGVLAAGDLHVAGTLARLGGEPDPLVALAAALTVRALRMGHVCAHIPTLAHTVTAEHGTAPAGALPGQDAARGQPGPGHPASAGLPAPDASGLVGSGDELLTLPWPDPGQWAARLADSPLVAAGDEDPAVRPLRLVDGRLYLDRYWHMERAVAAELAARWDKEADQADTGLLASGLRRLFPGAPGDGDDQQMLAVDAALRRRLTVVAGGPGTGKTTTVARIVALLLEQAAAQGAAPARLALAAPTGRAAARLQEAVQREAAGLDIDAAVAAAMRGMQAVTLHRLLGWRPGSHSRFRYDAANRLPYTTVIVDETSMVSLPLMASLLAALRPACRLVLVGDPQQLASVEAGAVLGDIAGPALASSTPVPARLAGPAVPGGSGTLPGHAPPPQDGIVVLRQVHRYGGEIAALATAISAGDEDGALDLLRQAKAGHIRTLCWVDPGSGGEEALAPVRAAVAAAGTALSEAALAGNDAQAFGQLGATRILCAHREGPHGAAAWNERVERWLRAAIPGYGEGAGSGGEWYPCRPVLVTRNNYELQLYNGDAGITVRRPDGSLMVVFERQGASYPVNPSRLEAVETLHASTVHKAQGSQFDTVFAVLPEASSRILTRELLYTAVTRARRQVTVVGEESSIRAAIRRPIGRASGLRERLWGAAPTAVAPVPSAPPPSASSPTPP